MSHILGISAYYHDSAAALIEDGRIIAAVQEERFTRKKHDAGFPSQAIESCLKQGGITTADLDYVAYYDKPLLKFDRLLETYLAYAPAGFPSFLKAMPLWLNQKLHLPRIIRDELAGFQGKRIIFTEHHESHAASAFFPSPFEEAAIVTMDGVGEWTTTSIGVGRGNRIKIQEEIHFPHSLGLLYSAFTYFCGFRVNSGEYKLMGLAPYGEPKYESLIREHLIDLREDGSFRLDMDYFSYCQGLRMTNRKFDQLFGGPPRVPEGPITQREMDLAASIQAVTEDAMLRICKTARQKTGSKHLCLAGGVALNCVGNGRILREAGFDEIWIQPAAGDAGAAVGAAMLVWHQLLENPRQSIEPDAQEASLLGPSYSSDAIENFLKREEAVYKSEADESVLLDRVASLLAEGKVIGWFQGRMEFGPRALGSRSILGNPQDPEMQSRLNLKIKYRESFRPFAAMVMKEYADEYFEIEASQESPYMLLVTKVRDKKLLSSKHEKTGLDRLHEARSVIPAVTHVDDSSRLQTVDRNQHPRLHRLMEAFRKATECPVLINTSFNVRGEPIVCSPEDAYRCFMNTEMDVLVMGDHLLLKEEQPEKNRPAPNTRPQTIGPD